jgi:hypothetical protein
MTSPDSPRRRSFSAGRLLPRVLMGIVVITVAGLIAWGFVADRGETAKEAERDRPVAAPLRIAEADGQPAVKLDAQTREKSGIEVAALLPAPYQNRLRGYGSVLDLPQLTDLTNSYANARAQLQMAQAKLAASKTAFERAQGLYRNQQNVSLAQVQMAEAALQTDEATLAAADSQVRTLTATVQQNFGPIVSKSLLDGSPLVTRLIEQQDFLLQVTLPPGVTLSSPPKEATLEVEGGMPATATFVSLAARTDPRIQGVSFLYLAPASSLVLPGMNLLVSLPSGPPRDGVAIPSSAIVWWQDRAWIYRQAGADMFVRTEIPTSLPTANGGYIVKDLPKDAKIVTQGAQLLLSEEFRARIQVGDD